jgi:hypothetical protein
MNEAVLATNLATGEADEGYAFIAAVHDLVANRNKATKTDLLLAAASHALRSGDKNVAEVVSVVNQIWPGARSDEESVNVALQLGSELGLMKLAQGLESATLWSLTVRGVEDVDKQVAWVSDVRSRAIEALKVRAADGLGADIDDKFAELLLERLVSALITGIQASQDAYFGRVDELVTHRLVPRGFDQSRVFAALDIPGANDATIAFLKAAALAAIDPLDPFGDEIVSTITTGCVLHSYVAGRDGAKSHAVLGAQEGQRAVLDTPVLLDLIGPARVREAATVVVRAAVSAGWEVIAAQHSLDELEILLERRIPMVIADFREASEKGIRQEWYASLMEDELPSYCIEALRDGTYMRLEEFVDAARGAASMLEDLGVIVRPHGNEGEERYVERARHALEASLEEHQKIRSAFAIERDAQSMAMVWRRRRKEKAATRWPGGWIISSDRRISPAYKTLEPKDKVPLTLSTATWSTLLVATVPPAEVIQLAEAAAAQLVEEAMWLLPARFPSSTAMSLARQLSPEHGGSEMDIRLAQLDIGDSFESLGSSPTPSAIAAEVLEARVKRNSLLQQYGLADAKAAQHLAESAAKAARASASAEAGRALAAEQDAAELERQAEELKIELSWTKTRSRRILLVVVLAALCVIGAVATWGTDLPRWSASFWLIPFTAVAVFGYKWSSRRDARAIPLVVSAVVEVAGVASIFIYDVLPSLFPST